MAIPEREITVSGKRVRLTHKIEQLEDGSKVILVTAQTGESSYKSKMTIAPNPDLTLEQLQSDLDKFQQAVATQVAGREQIRNLLESL